MITRKIACWSLTELLSISASHTLPNTLIARCNMTIRWSVHWPCASLHTGHAKSNTNSTLVHKFARWIAHLPIRKPLSGSISVSSTLTQQHSTLRHPPRHPVSPLISINCSLVCTSSAHTFIYGSKASSKAHYITKDPFSNFFITLTQLITKE